MQWAAAFYANHSLDGAMDTRWSENINYCVCVFFYRQMRNFVSRTYHTNGLQTKIEGRKCVPQTHFMCYIF